MSFAKSLITSGHYISRYIDSVFEKHLATELDVERDMKNLGDKRIHVCLYLLPPTGRQLTSLDLSILKELHSRVGVMVWRVWFLGV